MSFKWLFYLFVCRFFLNIQDIFREYKYISEIINLYIIYVVCMCFAGFKNISIFCSAWKSQSTASQEVRWKPISLEMSVSKRKIKSPTSRGIWLFFFNPLSLFSFSPSLQFALTLISPLPSPVEGSHGNDGLLLGRPLEEPDQPITEKSLLEILDGVVMMYNLSVHQQLGKVQVQESTVRPSRQTMESEWKLHRTRGPSCVIDIWWCLS